MRKNIINIGVFFLLTTLSSWTLAATSTAQDDCNETIDNLAQPYQLQYRPSLSSNGCGIGSLTKFNVFNGEFGLFGADFFGKAICSAVNAKISPYVNQINAGVSSVNNGTDINNASSNFNNAATQGFNSAASGQSPTNVMDGFSSGTTSNLNQLFR